jgi:hypothetical protein
VLALTVATEVPDRIARVVSINPYDYGESFGGGIRRSRSGWIVGLFSFFRQYTLETPFFLNKVLAGAVRDANKLPDDLASEFFRTGQRPGYRWVEYSVFDNWHTWIDARERYSLVRAPVTLVYSEFDWSREEERLRNRGELSSARYVLVAGAGHFSALEKAREIASAIQGELRPSKAGDRSGRSEMKICLENDSLRLQLAPGASIHVICGTVWITETGVRADTFLSPGQRHLVKGKGVILVAPEAGPTGECSAEIAVNLPPHGIARAASRWIRWFSMSM